MPKPKVELSLFNRTEATHYLGVNRGYVNLLIEQGELMEILLPFQTSFKGRRIPKKTIDEFIERKLSTPITFSPSDNQLLKKYIAEDE